MSIIFLTIPGENKRDFARRLHKATNLSVDCVIVQKSKSPPVYKTLNALRKSVGIAQIPKELWYGFLLRINAPLRTYLDYFRLRSPSTLPKDASLKYIEVNSVNSERVQRILKEFKPKVLVVWGTGIVKPFIFKEAKHAINMHMGFCPYYRGAPANQFAVLDKAFDKIGATVHYLHEKVDAGEIIQRIQANTKLPPSKLFRELNDEAEKKLIEVVKELLHDDIPPTIPQNNIKGKNILLREWVPSRRYRVAKIIESWEKEFLKHR